MEAWYDQWLRLLGSAVVRGPSDCAGQIPSTSLADMAPPRRRACARLASRLTVLSDGNVVACEEDVMGKRPLGRIGEQSLGAIWQQNFTPLRDAHAEGRWEAHPLCGACKEWHRP
jgi:radical SAM protein with 4Fe4S-binding SPASM domain